MNGKSARSIENTPPIRGNKLLTHSLVYLVGDLIVRGGSLLLVPLYTRALPLADYGAAAMASLLATVVSYVAGMSLSAAVIKIQAESGAGDHATQAVNGIIKFISVWAFLLVGVLSLAAFFAAPTLFSSGNPRIYLQLAVISGCLSGVTNVLLGVFQSRHQSVKYRLVTIVSFVANVAMGFIAVVLLKWGGLGAVIGQLAAAIGGFVVALVAARVNFAAKLERPIIRRALAIGVPLTIYSLGGFSTDQLSRIFVERYVSLGALGIYSIAALYCTSVTLVFSAINTAWVPKLFQFEKEEGTSQSGLYGTSVLVSAIGLGGVMVLLAPIVIRILTGPSYHGAAAYVPLLMINAVLGGPVWSLVMNPLVLTGRNWCIAACAFVSGGCNLLLNFELTRKMGIWGAPISSLISLSILVALAAWFSAKVYPVVYEFSAILRIAAVVFAAFGLATAWEMKGSDGDWIRGTLACACLGLTGLWLNRHRSRAPVFSENVARE